MYTFDGETFNILCGTETCCCFSQRECPGPQGASVVFLRQRLCICSRYIRIEVNTKFPDGVCVATTPLPVVQNNKGYTRTTKM